MDLGYPDMAQDEKKSGWLWIAIIAAGFALAGKGAVSGAVHKTFEGLPRQKRGNRLFYLYNPWGKMLKSIPHSQLKEFQKKALTEEGSLYYVWAGDAEEARYKISRGQGERYKGFSGISANCALWQEVETGKKDFAFRCLKFASSCKGQKDCEKPAMMSIYNKPKRYKATLRICSGWKEVFSPYLDWLYKQKKIEKKPVAIRCSQFKPLCSGKTCLEKSLEKPARVAPTRAEVITFAKSIAANEAANKGQGLAYEILSRGGIRAHYGHFAEKEEYLAIPIFLRNRHGLTADEMAAEIGFEHENQFMEAIAKAYPKGTKKPKKPLPFWEKYYDTAYKALLEEKEKGAYNV